MPNGVSQKNTRKIAMGNLTPISKTGFLYKKKTRDVVKKKAGKIHIRMRKETKEN